MIRPTPRVPPQPRAVTDDNLGLIPAPLTAFDAVAALEELAARNSWANEAPEAILRPVRAESLLVLSKEMREQLYVLKGRLLKACRWVQGGSGARTAHSLHGRMP